MWINSLPESLPFDRFATENFRPHEQFDAWRHSISVAFDIDRPPETARLGFRAEVTARKLGSALKARADTLKDSQTLPATLTGKGMVFNEPDPQSFRDVLRQAGYSATRKS